MQKQKPNFFRSQKNVYNFKIGSWTANRRIFRITLTIGMLIAILSSAFYYFNNLPQDKARAAGTLTLTAPNNGQTAIAGQTFNLTASASGLNSQTASSAPLGIGLNGMSDYSTEFPFLNQMKLARSWSYSCWTWQQPCTKTIDDIAFDSNGYPLKIPKDDPGASVSTYFLTVPKPYSQYFYKTKYVVKYDGEGQLDFFQADIDQAASTPGRIVINLKTGYEDGETNYAIGITDTDPNNNGNYLRNLRIVPYDQESLLDQGEIFNPDFLDKQKNFDTIRFMDWMHTNWSTTETWSDRITPSEYTWTDIQKNNKTVSGVPVEIIVALANKLDKNIWINMPHRADDNYQTEFANYIKNNLKPNLITYVEYSNEVWNFLFSGPNGQASYANDRGRALWPDQGTAWVQWNGVESQRTCNIWKNNVFASEKSRVRCIIGTQAGWRDLVNDTINCPNWVAMGNQPCWTNMDGLAITWYFTGGLNDEANYPTKKTWMDDPNPATRFNAAAEQLATNNLGWGDSIADIPNTLSYFKNAINGKIPQIYGYEGGTHVTNMFGNYTLPNGNVVSQDPQSQEYDDALNHGPQMGQLYSQALATWKNSGGGLLNAFVDVSTGTWGNLQHVKQETSPRWEALQNYALANNSTPPKDITKVEFFRTDYGTTGQTPVKIGEDTNANDGISYSWSNPPAGDYNITAVATLSDNTTLTAAANRLTLTNPNLSLSSPDLPNLLTLTNLACTDASPDGQSVCTGTLPSNMLPPGNGAPGSVGLIMQVQGASSYGDCNFSSYAPGSSYSCTLPVSPATGSNLPIQASLSQSLPNFQPTWVNTGETINVVQNNALSLSNVNVFLIDGGSISYNPAKAQAKVFCGTGTPSTGCADLTVGIQNEPRISSGATCYFVARPYPTAGSPDPAYQSNVLTNNGVVPFSNGSCQVTLAKSFQSTPKWEFKVRVQNPNTGTNASKVYGTDFAYFMLYGAIGVVTISGSSL